MKDYFKIIRQALRDNREKGKGVYYEAHHIIPKCFRKSSTTVLLTPEEHYEVHRLLANYFSQHSTYGQKMLWAFHRLAYDKGRKLTKDQFGESRKILQPLWKQKKTKEHKEKISKAQKGNTNNKSRVYKGMKSDISETGRKKLAEVRRTLQTGKTGKDAQASKGPYTVEYSDGFKIIEYSYQLLSEKTGIKLTTLHYRLVKKKNIFISGWKVY